MLKSVWMTGWLSVVLFGGSVLADGLSFDLDEGDITATPDRAYVMTAAEDVALRGIPDRSRQVRNAVRDALKDQPEGTRVRVTLGHAADGAQGYTWAYPRSVVPLDDEDRRHGVERLITSYTFHAAAYSLIPWRHGRQHGVETRYIGSRVRDEIPWEDGRMHGTRKTYFPSGNLQSETAYVEGVASGPTRTWDDTGSLIMEGQHENGNRHGVFTEYWPGTTQPRRQMTYRHGVVEGVVRDYHETGERRRERRFVAEALHGRDELFDENGALIQVRYWYRGDPVTEDEFASRSQAEGQ